MRQVKNYYHLFVSLIAAVLYRFPAKNLTVIGVTGTDGKTTTTHLLYHILKTAGLSVSFISTIGARIGEKKADTGLHVTTPSAFTLQKLISNIRKEKNHYLILEVTSHALDQYRTLGTSIDIAVITNISHEHIDYHKTFTAYRAAKAKILANARIAVLNSDDANFDYLSTKVKGKLASFSLNRFKSSKWPYSSNIHLLGDFNKYNILAASTVARLLKVDQKKIKQAIASFPGIPGRLEEIKNRKRIKIYIDFAHKPNALKNVLQTIRGKTKKRIIAVFGCAGLRDRLKRPMMGEIAAELADLTVITAEDPRTEDVRSIINQIAEGLMRKHIPEMKKTKFSKSKLDGQKYFFKIPDRQEAINFAIRYLAKTGDTVIILGKGHEKSMCYQTTEFPWSERQAVHKALYGSIKNSSVKKIN